jgi:hypothetical protein
LLYASRVLVYDFGDDRKDMSLLAFQCAETPEALNDRDFKVAKF